MLCSVSAQEHARFRFPVELAVIGNVVWPGFGLGSLLQGDLFGTLIQFFCERFPAVMTLAALMRYKSLPDAEESLVIAYLCAALWLGVLAGRG